MKIKIHNQKGYVALISVLLFAMVSISMVVGLFLQNHFSLSLFIQESAKIKAQSLALACAEHTLFQLRENSSYTGGENIVIDSESCSIDVISGSGETNREFTVFANVQNVYRKLRVQISDLTPVPVVDSWKWIAY